MSAENILLPDFAYAYGKPTAAGKIRVQPEDFQVDEIAGFEASGEGEHVLLLIRKRNTNTEWLARQLAHFAAVKPMDVSFAGLKDRNAVTTQWFSVRLPGVIEPDWVNFSCEDYQVLQVARHSRKLRRGSLQGNHFTIRIREVEADYAELESRLQLINQHGVPNYFGEQRFGHDGENLARAYAMLVEEQRVKNRHKRSLYISAARSMLFNVVCSARVSDNTWLTGLDGDAMMLTGSHSFFIAEHIDELIQQRLRQRDIGVTAPLWGRGPLPTDSLAKAFEMQQLAPYQPWLEGLEKVGLKQERRRLQLLPENMRWQLEPESSIVNLEFTLPSGSYATSLLRECLQF